MDNTTAIEYGIRSLGEKDTGNLDVAPLSQIERERVEALINEMRGKGAFSWNGRMLKLKLEARKRKLSRHAEGRLLELGLIAWRASEFIDAAS